MRKRIAIIGITAVVLSGAGAAAATAGHDTDPPAETKAEATYTAAHEGRAEVSRAEAERTALALHKGAAFDTHLQDEGTLTWEVKVEDGTHVWEVNVDAQTGKVVSDQGDE
ncbi:MAG: Peptidase propeptide and domain [Ilumatobacteraceae bacterium]|nr:Peptidase propeptide and domain [Ilumatobacteraceae bacterium]